MFERPSKRPIHARGRVTRRASTRRASCFVARVSGEYRGSCMCVWRGEGGGCFSVSSFRYVLLLACRNRYNAERVLS